MLYSLIFPFITEYITVLGAAPSKIGLYAGVAEGALMLIEAVFALSWARLSDRYGRKRTWIGGFVFTVWCSAMVGFGKSVGWIIFWRAMVGLNPAPVLNKIVVVEISHPSNRARVFAIFSPAFPVGEVIGSLIGGGLANPYGRLPRYLGGALSLLKEYPYALPCLASSSIAFSAMIIGSFMIQETHRPVENPEANQALSESNKDAVSRCLKVPNFVVANTVFGFYQLGTFMFEGFFTVYAYTAVSRGGLGLTVENIGNLVAAFIFLCVILTPVFTTTLQSTFGFKRALQLTIGTIPIEYLLVPAAQWMARRGRKETWAAAVGQLTLKSWHLFAWPMCDHAVFRCFDEYPESLATGSAISMIAGAFSRAAGPAIAGWVFSLSSTFPTLSFGRQISWITMFVLSVPAVIMTRYVASDSTAEGYIPINEGNAEEPA
ncbi:hypothetical protein IAT38_002857 [Cryptococcus sp. DSM 104549]